MEGEYLPPPSAPPSAPPPRPRTPSWRTAAGSFGAIGVVLTKFKAVLVLLGNLKLLVLLPKVLALFGSIVFYALFFGWKFGIVFVLLILVHELGHYLTFRNFGIAADLPFFIPGLGAFVARRGPAPSLTIDALAALAGPIYGLAASGACLWLAHQNHDPFWRAAAYTGFFLNALNLIPLPPLDGGNVVAAVDPRLWVLGGFAFLVFVLIFRVWAGLLLAILIGFTAVPRLRALFAGYGDPRLAAVPLAARVAIAAAYFAAAAIAVGGAAASYFDVGIRA